jgi:hypothetical protein
MLTLRHLCHGWLLACVTMSLAVGPLAAKDPDRAKTLKELQNFDEAEDEEEAPSNRYNTRVETPLIGEYTTFAGLTAIKIEGVGLVAGLRGTGGNPAPSPLRTALLEDLKRRNVRNPNEILKSPDTALVYLRAFLPPLLEKGETIDVQVWIPESAEATSLEGGWLMEAYLSEQAFVPGKGQLTGHHYARAKGPILTAAVGENKKDTPALVRRGLVLGGGSVMRERELSIYLRNDFRSIRNAMRIAEAISRRFHDFDKHGLQQPMAVAKNDQRIPLLVHPKYKNNFPRYLQVIRHLAFREQPTARRLRMQRLKDELQIPEKSEQAALQLEGIGSEAIPVLKAGLSSPLLECRFHAATALAYLGETDGVDVLAEAARTEPAFRVFALAALSVIDDADAHIALRKLMKEASMETRYGAFRALWVLDKNDPFIQGEIIKVMGGKTGYMLHEVDTQSEPLVHVTTRTRPEIVLFGADQKFTTPLYLTAGKNIMITAQAGSPTASVRRFSPNQPDERRDVPLTVADVIRAASELDATYPDVVQMLTEAARQHNLQGRFAHDALPEAGRMYERPVPTDGPPPKGSRKTRIGRDHSTPNLFQQRLDPEEKSRHTEEPPVEVASAMSNVPPERRPPATPSDSSAETSGEIKEKTADSEKGSRSSHGQNPRDESTDDRRARKSILYGLSLPRLRRPARSDEEPVNPRPKPKGGADESDRPADQTEPQQ